ncbi:MAG: DUF4386 domain-containing protein [Alphaproteobacteria bacterium]|nr:DUF4386 domain-containing protein [Alphaproteobacteria bacterium]
MQNIKIFARATGFIYFLLIPLGVFGIMYVPTLVVKGDITTTISNLLANESLVRWSIAAALTIQLIHFALVLMLYKILKPINKTIASIMVLLVMVGVPIAMLNEFTLGGALLILNGTTPAPTLVSTLLGMHQYGINIVQIFWGLWLFPLGYLIYKSDFLPKLIGITLMIGCFGYVIDSTTFVIDPTITFKLASYLFIGELLITFWLLFRGLNAEKWHAQNDQPRLEYPSK